MVLLQGANDPLNLEERQSGQFINKVFTTCQPLTSPVWSLIQVVFSAQVPCLHSFLCREDAITPAAEVSDRYREAGRVITPVSSHIPATTFCCEMRQCETFFFFGHSLFIFIFWEEHAMTQHFFMTQFQRGKKDCYLESGVCIAQVVLLCHILSLCAITIRYTVQNL